MNEVLRIAIGLVWWRDQVAVGVRREGISFSGYDEFPGGKCEEGESFSDAVIRECFEETGLSVRVTAERARIETHHNGKPRSLCFFDVIPDLDQRSPADQTPPALLPPFQWTPVDRLPSLRFPPANQPVLDALLASLPARAR